MAQQALAARWPKARIVALDASPAMLREAAKRDDASRIEWLLGEAEALPLPEAGFDLVFSNLMLPWCEDLDAVFAEVARVLKPRGLFTFTTFGPDTLVELRAAWRAADEAAHVHPFTDMHDLGDGLVRAGFSEPVLDVSRYTLTYPDVDALMRDLKAIGAQNASSGRGRAASPAAAGCRRWPPPTSRFARGACCPRAMRSSSARPGVRSSGRIRNATASFPSRSATSAAANRAAADRSLPGSCRVYAWRPPNRVV